MLQTIVFPPESKPEHCWDWISPAELFEVALTAYQAVQHDIRSFPDRVQAEGNPETLRSLAECLAEGDFWADRAYFLENLIAEFDNAAEEFVQRKFNRPGLLAEEILKRASMTECQPVAANEGA